MAYATNFINFKTPGFFKQVFFLIFIFRLLPFSAQFYQVRNFNSEDGLPSPEVYGLMQDSKGYMWFATDMGVSRYNGTSFENFSTEKGMPDNTIFGFCEDAKKRVWFRSFSGKLSYFLNDSIYTLPCNDLLEKEIRDRFLVLFSMHVDAYDTIWVGVNSKVLLKIAPPWKEQDVKWISVPGNGVYLYLLTNNSSVFGGSAQEGDITVYNRNGIKVCSVDSKVSSSKKYFAKQLNNGEFIASISNVILKFTKNGISDKVEQKEVVNTLSETKNGKIISSSYNGVHIHDLKRLSAFKTISNLENKVFTGTEIDEENGIWLGAEGQGAYYIPFPDRGYYTTQQGLTESKISCIAEKNGAIITGHLNGTVSIIRDSAIRSIRFKLNKNGSNNRVNTIYTSIDSDVFIGTGSNTFKLDKELRNYKNMKIKAIKKINKSQLTKLLILRGRIIGLYNNFEELKLEKEININRYIETIFEDSKGTIWICAINGLWNYANDTLSYLGKNNELLSARYIDIAEDSRGRLWMATRGRGIVVKADNVFQNITKNDGLASNMCRNLYIDSSNTIWVGSNSGLSKINVSKGTSFNYSVSVYTQKEGLLSNEVNYIIAKGTDLIIAHNNGISIVKPSQLNEKTLPPPIYISNTEINSCLYKQDTLTVYYSPSYTKINYIGISFKSQGSVEYKYRMEGLDTSWVYTLFTSAQFQKVSPGKYKFIVYAKNNDGNWSDKPAVLHLSVLPLWWQTWAFKIILFCVISLIVFIVFKSRLEKIKVREKEKVDLQNQIATTELKALRAQMNPHFIFNAINSVQYFMTSNDPQSSQKYLSKFARLIRYVLDNSKPGAIPLVKEIDALKLYMDLEVLRFGSRFTYNIFITENIDQNYVQIPSMLIQPYVENAIWHGIMHKKGDGKINIGITMKDAVLTCIVEDNGIGRVKSKEMKSTESLGYHSIGMSVTKERIELISKLNNIKAHVNIFDLYEKELAIGTKVEINIPFF